GFRKDEEEREKVMRHIRIILGKGFDGERRSESFCLGFWLFGEGILQTSESENLIVGFIWGERVVERRGRE
ncbi:hypothetical protein M9458_051381, partial [Cirrhinus mrigala]